MLAAITEETADVHLPEHLHDTCSAMQIMSVRSLLTSRFAGFDGAGKTSSQRRRSACAIFVIIGLALTIGLWRLAAAYLILPLASGFMLLGPGLTLGFQSISRALGRSGMA